MANHYDNQVISLLHGSLDVSKIQEHLVALLLEEFPFSPFGHVLNYLLAESQDKPAYQKLLNTAAAYSPDRARLQSILKNSFSSSSPRNTKGESAIPSESGKFDPDRSLFEFDFDRNVQERDQKVDKYSSAQSEAKETLSPYVQWLQSLKTAESHESEADLEALINDSIKANDPIQDSEEIESTQVSPVIETKQSDFFGEVITETLAEVLADQGQNEKAIIMYQKLSLIFPEKSAFFAARIEHLKNS